MHLSLLEDSSQIEMGRLNYCTFTVTNQTKEKAIKGRGGMI